MNNLEEIHIRASQILHNEKQKKEVQAEEILVHPRFKRQTINNQLVDASSCHHGVLH